MVWRAPLGDVLGGGAREGDHIGQRGLAHRPGLDACRPARAPSPHTGLPPFLLRLRYVHATLSGKKRTDSARCSHGATGAELAAGMRTPSRPLHVLPHWLACAGGGSPRHLWPLAAPGSEDGSDRACLRHLAPAVQQIRCEGSAITSGLCNPTTAAHPSTTPSRGSKCTQAPASARPPYTSAHARPPSSRACERTHAAPLTCLHVAGAGERALVRL